MAEIAAEFVRARPMSSLRKEPRPLAAKNATATVPIVFALPCDPIGSGSSRAWRVRAAMSPGCRVQTAELGGKRLDLLREIVPGLRRLAIMANLGNAANVLDSPRFRRRARQRNRGRQLRNPASRGYRPRLCRRSKVRFDAFTSHRCAHDTNRIRINTLALAARLPTTVRLRRTSRRRG